MDDREAVAFRRALGKRIRVLRVVRELTQDELAQSAGEESGQRIRTGSTESGRRGLDPARGGLGRAGPGPTGRECATALRADVPSGTLRSFGWDSGR